jgi:hypothetical protein
MATAENKKVTEETLTILWTKKKEKIGLAEFH